MHRPTPPRARHTADWVEPVATFVMLASVLAAGSLFAAGKVESDRAAPTARAPADRITVHERLTDRSYGTRRDETDLARLYARD